MEAAVGTAVIAINDALEYGYSHQPFDENRKCIDDWRQIGLGVFGLADAMVAMKIKYGSPESMTFVNDLFAIIQEKAIETSCNLAEQRGVFGAYDTELTMNSVMIKSLPDNLQDMISRHGLRNGTLLSIAPTGTLSLFMGAYSGGAEPLYKLSYDRSSHKLEDAGKSFRVFSHSIKDMLIANDMPLSTPDGVIKEKFPWVIESHEVPTEERVSVQSAIQIYVDNAISSTVNLPHSATPEDIYHIYMSAWSNGCKGITVFRDGCERGNILGVSDNQSDIKYDSIKPKKRGDIHKLRGETVLAKTPGGEKMYITVNVTDDGKLFEIFTNTNSDSQDDISTITRLTSLALRCGISVDEVIKQLHSGHEIKTIGDAMGDVLDDVYLDMENQKQGDKPELTKITIDKPKNKVINQKCPECGEETLKPDGHCVTCTNCGWSACQM